MKNKTKKEIEALQSKIIPLQNRIDELKQNEVLKVQIPRLSKMVGYCLRSTSSNDKYYGKVLDLVESRDGYPYFILEVCSITEQGNPYIHLDNVEPYLNKEWWDAEVPMYGWKKCSEEEYKSFKITVFEELGTQKSLRKFVKKN